ncbi:MAG TPA: HEPN domain-containing protein [Candidatus Omnitrophica bacterium]|nr:HEPN domain-containing protein [Candidatus Omnitrophota bacterium]
MPDKESYISKHWFEKADTDFESAEILLSAEKLGPTAFHLQQAIEKYLKGYLLGRGWNLKRTHDLIDLLNEAVHYEPQFEKFRSLCGTATEYYVEDRYPFLISSELNKEELEKAVKDASALIEFIKGID